MINETIASVHRLRDTVAVYIGTGAGITHKIRTLLGKWSQ